MATAALKDVVDTGISFVPDEYLRPKDHRLVAADEDIPVVDFSEILTRRQQVIDQVQNACREWGFFQLVGHGFPLDLMEEMDKLVHAFHNLPAEEKMLYYSTDLSKAITLLVPPLKLKWWHDMLAHMHTTPGPPRDDEMPKNLPSYKRVTSEYGRQVESLAKQLLGVISESLGFEPDALEKRLGTPRHVMRMTYYPPCPNPEATIGVDAHSDPGGLTILQQGTGIGGLQVLRRGRWVTVKPLHGAFVINMGDQIQILSNDKYKSVEHRVVVNKEKSRISIASFYNPCADAFLDPMVELLGVDPPVYTGCKYGEYLSSFMSKDLDSKTALDRYKTSAHVMKSENMTSV